MVDVRDGHVPGDLVLQGHGGLAPVLLQGDVLEAVLHQDFLAVQGDPEVAHGVQTDLEGALADDQQGPVQFPGVQAQGVADHHDGPWEQSRLFATQSWMAMRP